MSQFRGLSIRLVSLKEKSAAKGVLYMTFKKGYHYDVRRLSDMADFCYPLREVRLRNYKELRKRDGTDRVEE